MTSQPDVKVSSLVDRHIASAGDPDPDDLFAELEAEDHSAFRAARAQQLASELSKLRPKNPTAHTAADAYITLHSDDEVLRFTTDTEKCILHFLHPDFARCGTMDTHLQKLAERHVQYGDGEVKIGRVNVRDAAFVVAKLGVRVLPCVIGFVGGVAKGRIVGFEGVAFGGRESGLAVTKEIEKRGVEWNIFERRLLVETEAGDGSESEEEMQVRGKTARRGIQVRKQKVDDEDDDWD